MAISVNEGGKIFELDEVWVKEGNTLIKLDEVWANEGVNLVQIHSSFKPPDVISWTEQSGGKINSVSSDGYTVSFTSYIGVWEDKPAFHDAPVGHCCLSDKIYLKAGTNISAKRTAYSGYGANKYTYLTIYYVWENGYPDKTVRLETHSTTETGDMGIYTVSQDGYYRLGLYSEGRTYGETISYYSATSTVEITISK